MALSNWDTFAVTHDGKPSSGVFVSPKGVVVEVYKNWLYVRRPHPGHAQGERWSGYDGIVCTVNAGDVTFEDVHIFALRGPQNGVYAVVWSGYGEQASGMLAAGVYGYDGDEFVGVTDSALAWMRARLNAGKRSTITWADGSVHERFEPEVDAFEGLPAWARSVPLQGERFNQGDAFFAKHAGGGASDVATPVGGQEEPVLMQAFKEPRDAA